MRPKKAERRVTAQTLPRNWIIALILGVSFLAFSNSIFNGFAYDDTSQILNNKFIRDLRNVPKALVTEAWYWRTQEDKDPNKQDKPSTSYYRPIVMVYLMLLWQLFGTWAPGWHLLNVLLHMLAVYFVFLVFERATKDSRLSAIASLLFAVHPLRSESVAWVSGMTDPLMAVFLLAAFYLYGRHREDGKARSLTASLVLFILGAFTKEPAVVLPIFIAAYELFVVNQEKGLRERLKPAIIYSSLFLLASAAYLGARYYALGYALNNAEFRSYPFYQVAMTIPIVVWKYIGLLLWPFDLSIFHATGMVKTLLDPKFILPFLGLIALAIGLWQLRRLTAARFAILWFAINLLPVLNLGAFGEGFMVQERYIYLPSMGFSLLTAMVLARMPIEKWVPFRNRRAAQAGLVGVLVFLLAGKSLAQNTVWKDDMSVWFHGIEVAPEQPMSHYVLGHKLISLGDYTGAADQLEAYLKLTPDNLIVIGNLASVYLLKYQYQATANPDQADRGLLDRALELSEKGLSMRNDVASLWDALGSVHTFDTGLKNYDRAIACFQRGLSLSPGNPMISFHLGGTLVKKGNLDGGISLLKEVLEQKPELVDAHKFLAVAYTSRGQLQDAINELSTYLRVQPNAPDLAKISKDIQDLRARLQTPSPQS